MQMTRRIAALAALVVAVGAAALSAVAAADPPTDPWDSVKHRADRYIPKPAGTREKLHFWYGPYTMPAGWDANRVDLDLPLANGFIVAVAPSLHYADTLKEPPHQIAHIHHSHWFALDPGNKEDNYTYGNTEWIFGNGDEETKADFELRSAADPQGPHYGQYIGADGPQAMIYMLHNKTSQPIEVYVMLDVIFVHGTQAELNSIPGGRPWHDLSGVLFGRTFNVPRQPKGDGVFETSVDQKPIEWTSTMDGTIIGTGGHLHPGGIRVVVENMGSAEHPCPNDGRGYGGTQLLHSNALFRNGKYSEDFQMQVTDPAWRAPLHKGDRLRVTGVYENKDHAWYTVMTHEGWYIDEQQPPKGYCKPYLIGKPPQTWVKKTVKVRKVVTEHQRSKSGARETKKRVIYVKKRKKVLVGQDPIQGVQAQPWYLHKPDLFCGLEWGAKACEPPFKDPGPGRAASTVTIANFVYYPGDRSLSGLDGGAVQVKKGTSLTFVNADEALNIRHSVTTCAWPCNGQYVANYPFADGRWDSGTLGYDAIDGGTPNPVSKTPADLPVGKYAYFCRIHPWMRGAFEVVA